MSQQAIGITFQELMAGGVSLGEIDPAAGAARGASSVLTMHGKVTIDDIDAFISDPAHTGVLDVVMDWPAFGIGLPATGGVFNLFSPTDNPALKLMVYEWALEKDGKAYYFAGQKNVAVNPLSRLWKDTTTLYTQVHQGIDKSGPVVGAGVISLTAGELVRMTGTFTALNAPSMAAGAEAITRFSEFFLGELCETYIEKGGA